MKTIYIISVCNDYGEADFVFDEEGIIIDFWANNDADWRHEYFNGFMEELGINVLNEAPKRMKLEEKAKRKMKQDWS